MRILYISCHEVLAYDEAKLLSEIGHQVYIIGEQPGHMRPSIYNQTNAACSFFTDQQKEQADTLYLDESLPKWLVDPFDVIILVSRNDWVMKYWERIKHKRIVFRMIGQSDDGTQVRLRPYVEQGMVMLGYSPDENKRFNFFQIHSTIRFYKDPAEWGEWNGNNLSVLTSCRSIQRDGECCNPSMYKQISRYFRSELIGPGNEEFRKGIRINSTGVAEVSDSTYLSYEHVKRKYREHRVYLYIGTRPASYTLNFIEAWMTGIPVVSLGKKYNTNEVCDLMYQGIDGYYSNNPEEIIDVIKQLLNDDDMAIQMGRQGRLRAMQLFGKSEIKTQWIDFLKSIG